MTQAQLIEPYLGLREDLGRGAYANYVAELLDRFTADEEEAGGALFTLLHQTLGRIAEAADPRLAPRFFELQLLDLVGFRPELGECVISRAELKPEQQFFSHEEGGVVSRAAAPQVASRLVEIDFDTLKLLRHLQRSAEEWERVSSLRITSRAAQSRRADHAGLYRASAGAQAGERRFHSAAASVFAGGLMNRNEIRIEKAAALIAVDRLGGESHAARRRQ